MTRRAPVDRPDLRRLLAQVLASGGDDPTPTHEALAGHIRALSVYLRDPIDTVPLWSGPVEHLEMAATWRLACLAAAVDVGSRVALSPHCGRLATATRGECAVVEAIQRAAAPAWRDLEVMQPRGER